MGDLANRLWSAGIAIPLLVVLLASNTGKLGLLLAVIIRSSFEYYGCVFQIGKNEQLSTRWCNLARWHTWSSCIIPLVAFCFDFGHSVVALVFVLIGHSLLFIFFVSWKRIPFEPALFGTMCMALFGHFYIEFLLSHAVFLHNLWTCGKSVLGTWSIVLPIALALIGDNGAYVGGKFFGTHKVVPHLSPNKSLEGFLGAIFWTIGFSWIVFSLYRQLLHHPIAMAVSRIEMISNTISWLRNFCIIFSAGSDYAICL